LLTFPRPDLPGTIPDPATITPARIHADTITAPETSPEIKKILPGSTMPGREEGKKLHRNISLTVWE